MRRILEFIAEYKRSITLIVTLILSVSMMLMGENSKLQFARGVTTSIFNAGKFSFSWPLRIIELWHDNKQLRLQNLKLSEHISAHDIALTENERLRQLLNFQKHLPTDSIIVADVVGHDFDRIINALILDVGSQHGVRKNMSVVTADGLVGRVYEVYPSSSSVQIIKDINSKISGVIEDIYGIVGWEGGLSLTMYGIPLGTSLQKGQKVYTTGFGGVFPRGLLIGTVVNTVQEEVEPFARLSILPSVDFTRIHEVFILMGSERSDIWNDNGGTGRFPRPDIQ